MTTSFKIVRKVMERLEVLTKEKHGASTDAEIAKELNRLSMAYRSLTQDRDPISYSDPTTRFAYVFRYVAAHSSYVNQVLTDSSEVRALLNRDEQVRVACVGGGPGSELVGLLQACIDLQRTEKLSVTLLDAEDGWAETWAEVDDEVDANFPLSSKFRQVNVRTHDKPENLSSVFNSDLFLLVWFLSEIYSFRDEAEPFFKKMVAAMNPGALVVILDNGSPAFAEWADKLFDSDRFETLESANSRRMLPTYDEQKSDLGDYLNRFGGMPRLEAQAMLRVLRRRDK